MSKEPFRFKQFSVAQDRCAMKVGTDGVLLGAWVRIDDQVDSVLDIGTGTGLIALQMAQRSESATIDALEIEPGAFEQAVENFENSPWSDRLFCYHASLQEFQVEIDERYDLVLCNPPFYNNSYPANHKERNLARHNPGLDFEALLEGVSALLSSEGTCAFVVPFDREETFLQLGEKQKLYPFRIMHVRGNPSTPLKRSLIQMSRSKGISEISELTIETSRHVYTEDYASLVKDFYLKL